MVNPFYVHPRGDYGAGLSSLGANLQAYGRRRQENAAIKRAQERFETIKQGAIQAYRTGDPDVIAEYSLANPEISQALRASQEYRNQRTERNQMESLFDFYQNPSLENAERLVEDRKTVLSDEGVDPSMSVETDTFLDRFKRNPEQVRRGVEEQLAFMYPKRFKEVAALSAKGQEGVKDKYKIVGGRLVDVSGDKPKVVLDEPGGITSKLQKTGAFLVRDDEGGVSIATGAFDPGTGRLRTELAPLEGMEVISKLGETASEQTTRRIEEKRRGKAVEGEETRASALIERGIAAAESTAVIRRAIDLLEEVKTGGVRAAAIRAKQLFGVEGADEGELSNNLGKAVLSQLRETFGAAFTQEEGARLERIEAGFTKSSETNRRLLTQALRIAERTAKRAQKSAGKRGDDFAVKDIKDLLQFDLSIIEGQAESEQPAINVDPLGIR